MGRLPKSARCSSKGTSRRALAATAGSRRWRRSAAFSQPPRARIERSLSVDGGFIRAPRIYYSAADDDDAANSAAVLLAVQQEEVAEFVAIALGDFHGALHAVALGVIHGAFQAGGGVILRVHREGESQDDAISFLTGHVVHPISCTRRSSPRLTARVKEGGDPSPLEEERHPKSGIANLIRVEFDSRTSPRGIQ